MNRTYEEWLKYYENATKEQVIEDMFLDMLEIKKYKALYENEKDHNDTLNKIINKMLENENNYKEIKILTEKSKSNEITPPYKITC